LREEVAQRKRRLISLESFNGQGALTLSDRYPGSDIPALRLETEHLDPDLSLYRISDLVSFDDLDFLHNAYRAILKRPPDSSALETAVENIRNGRLHKIDLLTGLRFSDEGQTKQVNIPGLTWHRWMRRICRLPLVGNVVAPLYNNLTSVLEIKGQQRRFALALAQHQLIAHYVNDVLLDTIRETALRVEASLRLLTEQKETNDAIARLTKYLEDRISEEAFARRQEFRDRTREIEDLRRVYNKYRTQVELTEKDLKREMEHLFRKHQEIATQLVYQQDRLASRAGDLGSTNRVTPIEQDTSTGTLKGDLDAFFASFDEHFRGNRDEVKQRLRAYLPIVQKHQAGTDIRPIFDAACGRGEWLELLKEEGLCARGVDINSVLARQCRDRGLDVKQGDLFAELRSIPDASLGAVSAFHIVEHLPLESVIVLLNETLRTLRSGGLVLMETPNPENVMVGSCNFYFDPTHRNPLPNAVLRFLVESRGFIVVESFGLNPSDEKPLAADSEVARRFNQYFYGPMDYAIVARKV